MTAVNGATNGAVNSIYRAMNTTKRAVGTMNNGNRATSTVSRVAGAVREAVTAWNRAVTVTWNPWILHPHTVNTAGTASVVIHRITAAVHQVTGITATLRIIHLPAAVRAVTSLQSTAPHGSITVAIP